MSAAHIGRAFLLESKMPLVLNRYRPSPGTAGAVPVSIMRPSKWGNPFVIGKDGTRAEVIAKYRAWLAERPALQAAAKRELRGRDLVCCCAPQACHGDVLLEIANA